MKTFPYNRVEEDLEVFPSGVRFRSTIQGAIQLPFNNTELV